MNHWPVSSILDWRRLERGNRDQQRACSALRAAGVMELLAEFSPVLAGTIPLDVHLPDSDLDIVCCFTDAEYFAERLRGNFFERDGFQQYSFRFKGRLCVLARFVAHGFTFEVFGQDRPVHEQDAVLHLIAESRLLQIAGADARRRVRILKSQGASTEAAFARVFGLRGDPYAALRRLAYGGRREIGKVATAALRKTYI